MASIKGITLKNVKDFRGHEGEDLVQGDVYYKGKKVGFYSQDAWGGMDNFNLDYSLDKELRNKINEITNNYIGGQLFKKVDDLYNQTYKVNFHYEQKGYEYLFMDLLQLLDHENKYKKYSKKFNNNSISIVYKDLFNLLICSGEPKGALKDKTYFNYKSLNDFVIN
ncbi:MAG: hypothetical protein IKN65_00255 [Clostridia bacterium]|nr:hypothetical protein [Bacilli bacterium]MBR3672715.1 hypothetical protein [Clostridia bacterium]MBR4671589.1 hypothetical protein [Bacilli bacterium]